MDPRSPYLHHNRYSSHSFRPQSQPQPQPQFHSHPRSHPNFHSNPSLHASHHSPLPAAASPPPLRPPHPPPQTQFHHAPAQPQFNPQNPSFGYNPNNASYNHHRSHPDFVNFSESPRVLQQKPSENDLSRRLQDNVRENRVDSRELTRVSNRWPPERLYSSANLSLESHRHQSVNQTVHPIKIRQGLEGSSRFLDEREVMRRADDNYHRRFQFGTNSERSLRDSRTVSNQMNHTSSFESSRGIPFDNRVIEKQRWADGREGATDLRNSFIERGTHEVGVHERVQHSGKHQNYRSREELERHTGRGSREGSFEHSRTPRKLPQKKSALLRIQKPNFRYREEERPQFYYDDSKSMLSRVKDQIPYSDQGMEQQLRQGSPVQLDVSFKSNSLVAKAIVTPPSSSVVVSDPDEKLRSGKKRKLLFHNKDNPNTLSIKSSEQTKKLASVISATNVTSSSDLGLNQRRGEGIACGADNQHTITSVAVSSASEDSLGESVIDNSAKIMESKKDKTDGAVAKISFKVAKKKKIVKKVVKKFANSDLSSSSSQSNKKCDGTIVPDGLAHGLSDSPKPENDVAMASANASDSQLCLNQISLVRQNDKVEGICDATASQNGAEASFSGLFSSNTKRKRSGSASLIGSSGHEETQINEDKLKANSVDLMHASLNTGVDNILAKEIVSPEVDNIEDVEEQQHKLDNSLFFEKNEAIKSSNMLLQSKDNADSGSSSPEEMEILKGQPNSFDMVSGYGSDHGLMNSGRVTVSENAVTDSSSKEHCLGQVSQLAENGDEDKISNASCMDHSRMIKQSSLGDTATKMVANDKHLSPERVRVPVDGVLARESPSFSVSRSVSEEDTFNSKMSEANIEAFKGNLSKSDVIEPCLGTGNIVRPACSVDTTLRLSYKECSALDAGGQPRRDVFSVFPQESSNDFTEDLMAPLKQKQLNLSGSELKLPCTSDVNDRPIISHISVSSTEQAREAVVDPLSISDFPPSQKDDIASLPSYSGGECRSTVDSFRDSIDNDEVRSVHFCLPTEELVVQNVQSPKPSGLKAEQIADATTDLEGSSEGEKMVVDAGERKLVLDSVTTQCEVPSESQSLESDERLPAANVESESSHQVENDSNSLSKYFSSPRDGNRVSVPNPSNEALERVPGTSSSLDILSTLDCQFSNEKVDLDDELPGLPTIQGASNMSPLNSDPLNADISINSDQAVEAHQSSVKTGIYGSQSQPAQAASRNLGCSSSAYAASKKAASSTPPSKPRTWHRTDNVSSSTPPGSKAVSITVPKQTQLPKNASKSQSNSYIRKGNSLVRKPTAVAAQSSSAHNSNSLGADEAKKNAGRNNKTNATEPSKLGRNSANVSFEMPRTPPLPAAKPNHSSGSLGEFMGSLEAEPVNNIVIESTSGPVNVAESNDVMKFSEDTIKASENPTIEVGLTNITDGHNNPNDANLLSSNGKSITYVKRKSNQLVATSNPHLPVHNSNNYSTGLSDGYFKRRKHQLIRTSLEGQHMARFPDGSVNSDEQVLCNGTSSNIFTKRQFCKVVKKTRRSSKFSLVWTLRSSQLSNGNGSLVRHQKIWPHLCPWKRATYLKSSVPNVAASLINSSSSTMSRKLLLLRKRDTVYTRSKHGFSLRKSKVLSVGGSSLKWSKSIESRSKKANEEATLAVVEAERKKKEQSCASRLVSRTRNNSSHKAVQSVKLHTGERIFRIGSVCYKMDSSRRTLQRVSDGDSSHPGAGQTEKDARAYYVPRRLVIGKDEYVRIGNGNQLVRDPKKRTRILASEKVRWSLHTARTRLARKRKYCQFFTRFGKCNKDDGKCHYIHDISKIAVCTKFLKGLCSNADCKLTHKVIPERMPDCSYFLQGICSNKNCLYRHVHVNPNASTCEGFLRGYCADGDECRKKHSYVCPAYEETGSCPQGSKCKLHHPKNRGRGKKIKQLPDKKNSHGRYFGSMHSSVSEPGTTVTKKCALQGTSDLDFEGNMADYISLDFDEEDGETGNRVDEEMYMSDSDAMDFQSDSLDDLIKPIRIMNI